MPPVAVYVLTRTFCPPVMPPVAVYDDYHGLSVQQ